MHVLVANLEVQRVVTVSLERFTYIYGVGLSVVNALSEDTWKTKVAYLLMEGNPNFSSRKYFT
ncbi:hypothetical protein SORBI_3003G418733 [Sorghum bicolor]|uniref:Uncharacterized protein n=1 Tax=Sorghum bicolor TaxID=4558 RepID=A0A1W0W1A1_SORBI|nr:hypothetical protein SORBI_3003G418733 [Sorghum bicolor]